jgi:hypothetical protein
VFSGSGCALLGRKMKRRFLRLIEGFSQRDWEAHMPLSSKRLDSGEYSGPLEVLMRKRENGEWAYRRPTKSETENYESEIAW